MRTTHSCYVLLALALLAGCVDPKCPTGYNQRGDTCYRIRPDAGVEAGVEADLDADVDLIVGACEAGSCEAGDEEEAGPERPADPPAFAVARAGATCNRDQALACGGRASQVVLWCNAGRWEAFDSCSRDERCDPAMGATQGSCVPVPLPCLDRRPGEATCDGEERVACGVDLLDVVAMPCEQGFTCRIDDGSAACVDIDECALKLHDCDTDPVAECMNTDGGFLCKCPTGYRGTARGEQGCEDINECDELDVPCCDAYPQCKNTEAGYSCCKDTSCVGKTLCVLDPWG